MRRERGAAEARDGSRGCPVHNNLTMTSKGKEVNDATTATVSSSSAAQGSSNAGDNSRGLWRGIAPWIPFRGSLNKPEAQSDDDNDSFTRPDGGTTSGTNPGGGGCPVETISRSQAGPAAAAVSSVESLSSGCPVQHDSVTNTPSGGGLAAMLTGGSDAGQRAEDAAGRESDPAYNALNNEYVYGQEEYPGQEMPLSTRRQKSSIPKADYNPSHQPKEEGKTWVYPSEQQYYNAIKRKGYNASATDMPSTLAIHNAVNEKGWEMVKEWEKERAAADGKGSGEGAVVDLRLVRFTGRPQDMSPKAWINTYLLGYRPPFDRHDWVVKRTDGTEMRYVIDFYAGKAPPGSNIPVAMHLDVRPALDSLDAVVDRTRMFYANEVKPCWSSILERFKSDPGSSDPSEEDAPPPSSLAR